MLALPLFLSLLLALSAAHKLSAPERAGVAAAKLAGAQTAFGAPLGYAAAAIEAAAALALLFAESRLVGAVLAAMLWTAYAVLLTRRIGTRLDCGCSFGRGEKPVSPALVARAAALAVLAGVAAVLPVSPFSPETLFAASGFLALYLALDALLAIPHPAWRHG
jgi:Methylamine utilisation protein MauE